MRRKKTKPDERNWWRSSHAVSAADATYAVYTSVTLAIDAGNWIRPKGAAASTMPTSTVAMVYAKRRSRVLGFAKIRLSL